MVRVQLDHAMADAVNVQVRMPRSMVDAIDSEAVRLGEDRSVMIRTLLTHILEARRLLLSVSPL